MSLLISDYFFQKILLFKEKVLFINFGDKQQFGFVVGLNSSNLVQQVLSLNAGVYKISDFKNVAISFNGGLYIILFQNTTTGVLTTLSDLVSSPLITISTPTYTLSENLTQTSTPSSLSLSGSYPLTFNMTTKSSFSNT